MNIPIYRHENLKNRALACSSTSSRMVALSQKEDDFARRKYILDQLYVKSG